MQLSELKKLLAENTGRNIRFVLPTGTKAPPHAHVTEVALIEKSFIDCGGTFRTDSVCRLQTWFADDTDHRLTAGKLLAILDQSASFLKSDALKVDVEHEAPFVSLFPIDELKVEDDALTVCLGIKHTACLAEDRCLPPNLNKPSILTRLPTFTEKKCC
ncbi:MAG TPA: DUF6428 family protein [Verrucomicrobiae bacterium]|jgi:hypothetical protein